jgi:hypothetical protein
MRLIQLSCYVVLSVLTSEQLHAASELEQRAAISSATEQSFLAEEFSRLENVAKVYLTEKSRTSSGLWNLTAFYAGIGQAINNQTKGEDFETSYRVLEAKTKKWAQQFPNSPSAHIAHSAVLIRHGWAYRGAGYASKVKPESWAPFYRHLAMARDNLEKHKSIASTDPSWYETMMVIALAEGWERRKFDNLLNEALDREPLFYQTYFVALEYLLPKWHGSIDEIETFAQNAVKRTITQEGRGMYARIYWYASQTQFGNHIFSKSHVVWPRMKEGFDDVVSRYPDPWNLNNYARFACLAQDQPTTKELLRRTESSVVPEAWSPRSLRDRCTQWANQR